MDLISDDHIRALLRDDDDGPLPSEDEIVRCRECIADFIGDSDSGERVVLIDEDGRELFQFPSRTDASGLAEGELRLPHRAPGRLTMTARVTGTMGRSFDSKGLVMLLAPEGTSIVSDIDDTIKVSEIPAGKTIILRNTFLRTSPPRGCGTAISACGMSPFITCPWQLFRLLHAFLIDQAGFPEGTFHMKSLRTSLLDLPNFIRDLKNFVTGKAATKEQKIGQITALMENLPGRMFTLIGDSGELDPEVFTAVRTARGAQVEKIVIRDVVDARHRAPDRLRDVDEIIDAPLIRRGITQFK